MESQSLASKKAAEANSSNDGVIWGDVEYKLVSQQDSSARYGNCEICNKFCVEVFSQAKLQNFIFRGKARQSYKGDLFGHESCLLKQRSST